MLSSYVNTETKSGIATITFFTPDHNALPSSILQKLEKSILDAGASDDTRVIILRSGGDRTFCAGADFKELLSIADKEEGTHFFMGFAKVILAIRNCKKLVLGRVQGKAVGGGVGLAAACDYCFATKHAAIKLSEISIGIGPFVIGSAVGRKMGASTFAALTLEPNDFHDAEWAKQKGLYNAVLDTTEEMDHALKNKAAELVAYNPDALSLCKQVFWENTAHWPELLKERATMSGNLVLSKFTKETLKRYQ